MNTDLKALTGKMNQTCHQALEAAAGLCLSRGHHEVEIEHVLLKLLETGNTDLDHLLQHYGIDAGRFQRDVEQALDRLKDGCSRQPVLSPHLPRLLSDAWLVASVNCGESQIRSGHLVMALLGDTVLLQLARALSPEWAAWSAADLLHKWPALVVGSREATARHAPGVHAGASPSPALDQYTVNLTERAHQHQLDPVLGRDGEIRQMIDILLRRRQNNPILTGEAGVGKTAVVEGLALRIADGEVPDSLRNVALRMLDLGLLQAGASVKGEFERRLKAVIDEVKACSEPVILFIDEAHTLIGAGGAAGQNDAANLLKPVLARGELRTIAATTWSEYKKYFEKDPALARRFQAIKVEEPSEEIAMVMLRGMLSKMRQHHQVRILDEAVTAAVRLSHRYLTGRQLPDKAVSVLDTACARIALGQRTLPAPVEDACRHLAHLQTEIALLEQEQAGGLDHGSRLMTLQEQARVAQDHYQTLEQRWIEECEQVAIIQALQVQLEQEDCPDRSEMLARREQAVLALEQMQGREPLVQTCVDESAIAAVISAWTGIPLGKMVQDELEMVRQLQTRLAERVIGQPYALDTIARGIRLSRAGLEDPDKPIGVFLLVGSSGVGKTETALALAETLYGGERNLITINLSEFQEAHTVSTLRGSPPGYVGYGEGGVLTEAVRRKPYSVVLLDEVEKAHPDVLEVFFQVFDKGVMDDAEGREINFRNTVILLTSNVGSDTLMAYCQDGMAQPEPEQLCEVLRDDLTQAFKPAFLGRLQVVPYYPVRGTVLKQIIHLKLDKIARRFQRNHQATLHYDESLVDGIAKRCTQPDSGARLIDNILSAQLLSGMADAVLAQMAAGEPVSDITIAMDEHGRLTGSLEGSEGWN
ncbi:type VI secretion system ATPase TssH [Edwardsiella ictaluri]|uniref:Type VI secretion ATPase, ClpV1 family, putative n=2 Tax=Edwardsiella ictaluri TaxID=67780 RepID=C5BAE2_EDWI9|nr:type VI secretion system ATPase TssH [Edwardsiella ictaluri]ACR69912.1 type VI secretion ATPase, ClpV1 family, putative [Edwardsiella ictaluri 93-146]AVZ84087.1 type VI secretion system ATPase TssH [Edwardsiella ictaluri]EKS7764222.1 type VI secretion system ATPase TssH [Edwardsiella ictaluri]EKS7771081.1 type VI secretion system ATPase TssH [Edwardsiella ictaluri]EKS7774173.1 type VI secretion system ATPase TssH [Edwardsiella ictaluri]